MAHENYYNTRQKIGELYVNYFEVFISGLHSRRYRIQYQYPVKIWNGLFPKANELINTVSISVNYL